MSVTDITSVSQFLTILGTAGARVIMYTKSASAKATALETLTTLATANPTTAFYVVNAMMIRTATTNTNLINNTNAVLYGVYKNGVGDSAGSFTTDSTAITGLLV